MLFKKSYNIHDVLGHELILATNPKPKQKEKYIPFTCISLILR